MKKWILMLALMFCAAALPAFAQDATPEATMSAADLPDPVRSVYDALSAQSGLTVTPVAVDKVEFNDGCLGAPAAGEMCAMMITEGYRATFDSPYGVFEVRTSLTGDNFRFVAPLTLPANTLPAARFQYSGGIAGLCFNLIIGPDGSFAASKCFDTRLVSGVFATGMLEEPLKSAFLSAVEKYGDFDWASTPAPNVSDQFASRYSFHGIGKGAADDQTAADLGGQLTALMVTLSYQLPPSAPVTETPDATAAVALPAPVQAVYDQWTSLPGLSPEVVKPVSVLQANYFDSCLEVHLPNEKCFSVVTPGYDALFDTPYGMIHLRVALLGGIFRFASPLLLPANTFPALYYQVSGGFAGICNTLIIGPDGSYALSACRMRESLISTGKLPDEYLPVVTELTTKFVAFNWPTTIVPPAPDQFVSSFVVNGTGSETMDDKTASEMDGHLMELVNSPALAAPVSPDNQFAACSATPEPTPCPPAGS